MNKWYFDAANFAASNVYGIIGFIFKLVWWVRRRVRHGLLRVHHGLLRFLNKCFAHLCLVMNEISWPITNTPYVLASHRVQNVTPTSLCVRLGTTYLTFY